MKVYLDNIVFYIQNIGGISVYWNEMLKRLSNVKTVDSKYIEINKPPRFKEKVKLFKSNIIYEKKLPLSFLKYMPVNKKLIDKGSIFHSSYYRYVNSRDVKNIITVYDFTYEYYIKGISSRIHHYQKGQAIKNSSGIICISENTKKDLLNFYPGIDENKIKVIYLAASDSFYPILNFDISSTRYSGLRGKKIISFVGKRIKYKNFTLAVDILKNLPDSYHLLIIGGGDFTPFERELLSPVINRVSHFNNINSEELNIIYNLSFCYLYLSEYEGFGIPVLEAMQVGCPVICQNIASIPEVYGSVENLVMFKNNLKDCCERILNLEDNNYRCKIIEQGWKNVKRFNWGKTFDQTLDFYTYTLNL